MKKNLIFNFALMMMLTLSAGSAFSQENSRNFSEKELKSVTGLKPEDGRPAVVSSKEELETVVPGKILWMKEMVLSNKFDAETTIKIRESIWRFENAIVNSEK